jgi:A/G-specific adenine glycosylase
MTGHSSTAESRSQEALKRIRHTILHWFTLNQRDLPWRKTRDPYRILISEVMLQQTQVDRVIPKYYAFLSAFPTVQALASASTADVIQLWSGLGYNRRAVNLQCAAQAVVNEHAGVFPRDVDQLKTLPGIGPYTAGAIACFAFEQDVGFLDTNIQRVLHRLFIGPEVPAPARKPREMSLLASMVVPAGNGWEWNQAIMEFGALQCTSRKPACLTCPVQTECAAFPEIQTLLAEAYLRGFRRKNEETFKGSNRFYRGRIVAVLREISDTETLDLTRLGSLVREDYSSEHESWLSDVVDGLARDGLLEIAEDAPSYDAASSKRERRIRLPASRDANQSPEA